MVDLFISVYPIYFPMARMKTWLCNELVEKYGKNDDKNKEESEGKSDN